MDEQTRSEIDALREEVARLNRSRLIRVHSTWPRIMMFNLVRGLMVGLGTVLGASILLSVVVWSLSQIEFVPIIGEWATQVIHQVEATRTITEQPQ